MATIKQPTVHPIYNAQTRFFNEATGRWVTGRQPLENLNGEYPEKDLLRLVLTELRVMNTILADGLNVKDDLDTMRNESYFTSPV